MEKKGEGEARTHCSNCVPKMEQRRIPKVASSTDQAMPPNPPGMTPGTMASTCFLVERAMAHTPAAHCRKRIKGDHRKGNQANASVPLRKQNQGTGTPDSWEEKCGSGSWKSPHYIGVQSIASLSTVPIYSVECSLSGPVHPVIPPGS